MVLMSTLRDLSLKSIVNNFEFLIHMDENGATVRVEDLRKH
jgi:hypothetical protein